MKILILIITMLFSLSVLADCCNFEFSEEEISSVYGEVVKQADNCGDTSQNHPHNDRHHCGCAHLSHLKIMNGEKSQILPPYSMFLKANTDPYLLKISTFSMSIFHPPKFLA